MQREKFVRQIAIQHRMYSTSFSLFFVFIACTVTKESESWNNCVTFTSRAAHLLFVIQNLCSLR